MSDLTPYDPSLPALPDSGGALSIPEAYSHVPAVAPDAWTPDFSRGGDGVPTAPSSSPFSGAGAIVFGQPMPYDADTARDALAGVCSLGKIALRKAGIDSLAIDLSMDWAMRHAFEPAQHEPQRHRYNFGRLPIPAADRAYVNAWANRMHDAGVSERDAQGILHWLHTQTAQTAKAPAGRYGGTAVSDKEYDRAVARSEADADNAEAALRSAWGVEYESRIALLKSHLRTRPAQQREMLENSLLPDGMAALNSPDVLSRLLVEALGGMPANVTAEIEQIENLMRTDRQRYMRDECMQIRYRWLLQFRGAT